LSAGPTRRQHHLCVCVCVFACVFVCVCVCVCLSTIRRPPNPLARARSAAFEMQQCRSPAKWRSHTRTRACSHPHNHKTTSPVGTNPVAHTLPNKFMFPHTIAHRSASPSPAFRVRCVCARAYTHTHTHTHTCTRAWAHAQHEPQGKEVLGRSPRPLHACLLLRHIPHFPGGPAFHTPTQSVENGVRCTAGAIPTLLHWVRCPLMRRLAL